MEDLLKDKVKVPLRSNMVFIAMLITLIVLAVVIVFHEDKPELAIGAAMLALGGFVAVMRDLIAPPPDKNEEPETVPADTHKATVAEVAGLARDVATVAGEAVRRLPVPVGG